MTKFSIPYGRQDIQDDDIAAVVETLQAPYLTQGPKITAFENAFAKYVGSNYAVAVSNATAGLHLAVLALDLKKGERVITTPITFAASANCVRYAGGEVWFADIDPNTYLLSFESTKKLIASKPRGFFKGIIPVDFAGLPVDLEAFKLLANEHDLWIIEDACHAPGAFFSDSKNIKQYCGNGNYADIAIFSFHPVKHIACGEGGMVTTNSKEIYNRIKLLRSHGITKDNMNKNDGGWYYEMQDLGYNYRLTDIQAALGITQLSKNNKGILRRNQIAETYKKAFYGKIKYQSLPKSNYNAHHLFVIEVFNRKELYDYLHQKGVYAQIHYIPVHTLPYYQKIGYGDTLLTNAEKYYEKCISLPMYPTLSIEEQEYVIKLVLNFTKIKKTLETKRLILKPISLDELSDDYVSWMNDPEVIKYLESGGNYTLEKLKKYLQKFTKNPILFWAVYIKDSNKHIGNIKIDPINKDQQSGELGILMGEKKEWGKGYATEATETILQYCFNVLNLTKITLGVISHNISAIRLYEKLGFKIYNTKPTTKKYNNKESSILRMELKNE